MNRKSVNMWTLTQDIKDLKKRITDVGILNDMKEFNATDYTEFIKQDLNQLVKVWKHNGAYYGESSLLALFAVAENQGYNKTAATFKKTALAVSRQKELWPYEIQMVFVSYIEELDYYITCEGHLLTSRSLTKIKGNPYNSRHFLYRDGDKLEFNKALTTYSRFVDDKQDYEELDFLYLDGFYGNCGIDNLILKDAAIVPRED